MASLAEASTLFGYWHDAQADGERTPDMTDGKAVYPQQLAAALVMDLLIQGRLRLEQPYVEGRLKERRRSYRRLLGGIAILWFVLVLALFFVPLFTLPIAVPALDAQTWLVVPYLVFYFGVEVPLWIMFYIFCVQRPLNRWVSGHLELIERDDSDDLRHLTLGHLQRLGQRRSTFEYVRRAWKGRELRELQEKLKEQLAAQGCLVEQARPPDLMLRRAVDGRAVNRDHPVWLALREQLRALILERHVVDAQTAALAILLSRHGGLHLTKEVTWAVSGLYLCFAPHEYRIVTARSQEILAQQDAAIIAALGAERYDGLLAIRAVAVQENPFEK